MTRRTPPPVNKKREAGDHEAFIYFDKGALYFRSPDLDEVKERAHVWLDVFVTFLNGKDTFGNAVVALGYKTATDDITDLYKRR